MTQWGRGRIAAAVAALVTAGTMLVPATGQAAGATRASAAGDAVPTAAGTTYYAVGRPVCAPARAGSATCLVMRKVVVSRGTAGARALVVPDDAPATIGPAGGLTPADLATAYHLPVTGGSGQTVAIVDAYNDPDLIRDLTKFDTTYGLPACGRGSCIKIVNQTGGATAPADDTAGWSVEEATDVETVHALCQQCKMILVQANSESDADLAAAENEAVALKATVVSDSYGTPETATAAASYASAYNHPGVVLVASAGDDGYYSYAKLGKADSPEVPAAYPTVVAVGGTSLDLTQTGTRANETVWNDNGPQDVYQQIIGVSLGAGGGGCSTLFAAPSWQTSEPDWASTGCGTKRLVSDVAAVGDPLTGVDIYHSYACSKCGATGWTTLGGTSLAAPIIAASFALAGGAKGVSYPAQTLYAHEASANDVTTGGDGWCAGQGAAQCGDPNTKGYGVVDCDYTAAGAVAAGDLACDAGAGYDGPTGVGTPDGLGLFGG